MNKKSWLRIFLGIMAVEGVAVVFTFAILPFLQSWSLMKQASTAVTLALLGMISGLLWVSVLPVTTRQRLSIDEVTGLKNRLGINRALPRLGKRIPKDCHMGIIVIDIAHFGAVNDAVNIAGGNEVLKIIGRRLHKRAPDKSIVARLDSDDFIIIHKGFTSPEEAEQIAESLMEGVKLPIEVHGQEFNLEPVAGVALTGMGWPADSEMLIAQAQAATRAAKQNRFHKLAVYNPTLGEANLEYKEFIQTLRKSIGDGDIILRYQPEIDMRTGQVCAVEVLTRWAHPERGLLYPGAFIDVAEESGLVIDIGKYVIVEAAKQAAQWQTAGPNGFPVSVWVNVSANHLANGDLVATVQKAVSDNKLQPYSFGIEITESALADDLELAADQIRELTEMGVPVAIDDFGTGHSSLAYLSRLPVHQLKIDSSFTKGLPDRHDDVVIVSSIISLAESLGMIVVAEGVERVEQFETLLNMRCSRGQGYLWSKAVDAEHINEMVGIKWCGVPESLELSNVVYQQMDQEELKRPSNAGRHIAPMGVYSALRRSTSCLRQAKTMDGLRVSLEESLMHFSEAVGVTKSELALISSHGLPTFRVRWHAPSVTNDTTDHETEQEELRSFPVESDGTIRLWFNSEDASTVSWLAEAARLFGETVTAARYRVAATLLEKVSEPEYVNTREDLLRIANTWPQPSSDEICTQLLKHVGETLQANFVGVVSNASGYYGHLGTLEKEWRSSDSEHASLHGLCTGAMSWTEHYGLLNTTSGGGEEAGFLSEHGITAALAMPIPGGIVVAATIGRFPKWAEAEETLLKDGGTAVVLSLLHGKEQQFRELLDSHTISWTFLVGSNGRTQWSVGTKPVLGRQTKAVIERQFMEYVHLEDHKKVLMTLSSAAKHPQKSTTVRFRAQHANGEWIHLNGTVICTSSSEKTILISVHDDTQAAKLARAVSDHALLDEITGLPNAALLKDRLDSATKRAARHRRLVGIMRLIVSEDVDREVISQKIAATVRGGDSVLHIQDSGFIIIGENTQKREDFLVVTERVIDQFNSSDDVAFGVAFVHPGDNDPVLAVEEAEQLMWDDAVNKGLQHNS